MTVETLKKWIGEYVAVHVASQPFAGAPSRRIYGIHDRVAASLSTALHNELYRHDGVFFDTPVWWVKRALLLRLDRKRLPYGPR